jgi:hypothetical protein
MQRVGVTYLSELDWCAVQKAFSLQRGKPKRTKAMIRGEDVHKELELEVQELVEVKITSDSDKWAMQIVNLIKGCDVLLCGEQRTREIPVFGWSVLQSAASGASAGDSTATHRLDLNAPAATQEVWAAMGIPEEGVGAAGASSQSKAAAMQPESASTGAEEHETWLLGYVDELRLVPSRTVLPGAAASTGGRVRVVDTKTRSSAGLPGVASKRASRLQVCVYRWMLERMVEAALESESRWNERRVAEAGQEGLEDEEADQDGVETRSRPTACTRGLWWPLRFFMAQGASLDGVLGDEAAATLADSVLPAELDECGGALTVRTALRVAMRRLARLPPLDAWLTIEYISQDTQAHIGADQSFYSVNRARAALTSAMAFHHGLREPSGPPKSEAWKCKRCAFLHSCGDRSPFVQQHGPPPPTYNPETGELDRGAV